MKNIYFRHGRAKAGVELNNITAFVHAKKKRALIHAKKMRLNSFKGWTSDVQKPLFSPKN